MTAPSIQASNVRMCDITQVSATIKWDNGNGDARIVVIGKERMVQGPPESCNSCGDACGDDCIDCGCECGGTPDSPNTLSVRQFWPGYQNVYETRNGCYCIYGQSCDCSETLCNSDDYLPPYESLPVDNTLYFGNIKFGDGDQVYESTLGTSSSVPCPSPSPSPGEIYDIIIPSSVSTSSYVVYNGTANSVDIVGLSAEDGYYVSIYEYNYDDTCIIYNHEYNGKLMVANVKVDQSVFKLTVIDNKTHRAMVASIGIYSKNKKLADFGMSDGRGKYTSVSLPVGGYKIVVTAPNKPTYKLNNVFIKADPPIRVDVLQNDWVGGSYPSVYEFTVPKDRRSNTYEIKM